MFCGIIRSVMLQQPIEDTHEKILATTTHLVAVYGCAGVSMRLVGKHVPIAQSVIYHYYADKDSLLKAMYDRANRMLGQNRQALPQPKSATKRLENIIRFQIEHAELVVAVLKYYLHYREDFAKQESGTLPEKAILHVEEVLEYGHQTGEWVVTDLPTQSKILAHAINGYLLEYYPHMPTGKSARTLVGALVEFTKSSLAPRS